MKPPESRMAPAVSSRFREYRAMFPIVVASFSAMVALIAAATKVPGLVGEVTWLLSAAAAFVFFGALDAWDSETPAREADDQP
jgi:hypothetical protein